MHEKNSQFILLKFQPHLVRLLGKIHALSIEVLVAGQYFEIVASPADKPARLQMLSLAGCVSRDQ